MTKGTQTTAQLKERLLPPLWVLTVVAVAILVWLLLELRELVVLLVVGYSISYAIEPLLEFLERKKLTRPVGFAFLCGMTFLFLAVLFITAVPTIITEYRELAANLPAYLETARLKLIPILDRTGMKSTFLHDMSFVGGSTLSESSSPFSLLAQVSPDAAKSVAAAVGAALLQGYSLTLTLLNLFLLPFIVYYLSMDFRGMHERALLLFPYQHRAKVLSLASQIDGYTSAFVRGQFIVCSILFVLYFIGLAVAGPKLWFLLAVISGFGNIIPYIGFLTGITLTSVMSLVTYGDLWHLVYVWIIFGVVQFLEGTFITPKVLGDKVGLSPLAIILAIVAGGNLFGLLGIFLAVPAAAVIKVLFGELHRWALQRA